MKEKVGVAICFSFILINVLLFLHHGSLPYVPLMFGNPCDSDDPKNCKLHYVENSKRISFRQPYAYSTAVDLRIIVLTWNRFRHLSLALDSIEDLEMDGDQLAIEIWVDRLLNETVDKNTLSVARKFALTNNHTTVHIHPKHVGLYTQWIATYSSVHLKNNEDEIVMILEDDIVLSKFGYRWIKAVHNHFKDVPYFAGTSLKSFDPKTHPLREFIPRSHSVFMHRIFSTHAFSPKLKVWESFQKWFVNHYESKFFKPYVPNIKPTNWYKDFEKLRMTHTMWSMWMLYYLYIEQLFTVYVNSAVLTRPVTNHHPNIDHCFCSNGQAKGLHFEKDLKSSCLLVDTWNDEYVSFPTNVLTVDWNGRLINLNT